MHEWECEDCGYKVKFRQPELPESDFESEFNESKKCPECGGAMYFDEIEETD